MHITIIATPRTNRKCDFFSHYWRLLLLVVVAIATISLQLVWCRIRQLRTKDASAHSTALLLHRRRELVSAIYSKILPRMYSSITKQARRALRREMQRHGNGNLDSFIMEKGGRPIRNVVLTTWRSGSNFLGTLLGAAPGTFYYCEPLAFLGMEQLRSANDSETAQRLGQLKGLLNCDYSNVDDYLHVAKQPNFVLGANRRLAEWCGGPAKTEICANATFLSDMCALFPFQAAKITRMRLRLMESFLNDTTLNLRVLYLVRDPRGTMHSRYGTSDGCTGDCLSIPLLCSDLLDDFGAAQRFYTQYPDRFMSIRFEEVALKPLAAMRRIYQFFRLHFDSRVEAMVTQLTSYSGKFTGHYAIERQSDAVPFNWTKQLSSEQLKVIESHCSKTITKWGYRLADGKGAHEKSFQPLNTPPWPQMCFQGNEDLE